MRNKHIQVSFLERGGIQALSDWINTNPDGSYPLIQVVELVFDLLEILSVSSKHLEESNIAKILSLYAHNLVGYPHLATRALNIIQRWQAIVYNLSYKYDQEGIHDKKQRDLRERIMMIG